MKARPRSPPDPPEAYLHLSETALQLQSVLVVAAVESDHPLVVGDLSATLAVLHKARPDTVKSSLSVNTIR